VTYTIKTVNINEKMHGPMAAPTSGPLE